MLGEERRRRSGHLLDMKSITSSPGWQGDGDGEMKALEGKITGSGLAMEKCIDAANPERQDQMVSCDWCHWH